MRPPNDVPTAVHAASNARVATLCMVGMRKPHESHVAAMNADATYTVPILDRIMAEADALPEPTPSTTPIADLIEAMQAESHPRHMAWASASENVLAAHECDLVAEYEHHLRGERDTLSGTAKLLARELYDAARVAGRLPAPATSSLTAEHEQEPVTLGTLDGPAMEAAQMVADEDDEPFDVDMQHGAQGREV